MSTRSITIVYNNDSQPLVCLYRQFDGYPSGHGKELADFLTPVTLVTPVNGIGLTAKRTAKRTADGMDCLAAQLVAHFKKEVGGFYLMPLVKNPDYGQEYEYHVYSDMVLVNKVLVNKVFVHDGYYKMNWSGIFTGGWHSFKDFCEQSDE